MSEQEPVLCGTHLKEPLGKRGCRLCIFENAPYYDAEESEQLQHDSPEEAIVSLFESIYDPKISLLQQIRDSCPLEVVAHAPLEVTQSWIAGATDGLLEDLTERFDDEFGDPSRRDLSETCPVTTEVGNRLQALLHEIVAGWHVWMCDKVATREYSAEEVEAILREEYPVEHFEEEKRDA